MKRQTKICTIYIAALIICLVFVSCGKSEEAAKVDELILAIGTVTLDSEQAIETAEIHYQALTEKQKEDVENNLALIQARHDYDKLVEEKAIADQIAAEEEAKRLAEEEAKRIAEEEEAKRKAEEEAKKLNKAEQEIFDHVIAFSSKFYNPADVKVHFVSREDNFEISETYPIGYRCVYIELSGTNLYSGTLTKTYLLGLKKSTTVMGSTEITVDRGEFLDFSVASSVVEKFPKHPDIDLEKLNNAIEEYWNEKGIG